MNTNRDNTQAICSAFAGLIDNSAATQAAARLYQSHDGIRFCAEDRARLSAAEARALDAREAARRGQGIPEIALEAIASVTETQHLMRHDPASSELEEDDFEADAMVEDDHVIDLGDDDIEFVDDVEMALLDDVIAPEEAVSL